MLQSKISKSKLPTLKPPSTKLEMKLMDSMKANPQLQEEITIKLRKLTELLERTRRFHNRPLQFWEAIQKAKPSKVTKVPWIHIQADTYHSFPIPKGYEQNGGRLLIYVNVKHVDSVWEKIKNATQTKLLGSVSSVQTNYSNPHNPFRETHPNQRVICITTSDYKPDINRIKKNLQAIGIKGRLRYKKNAEGHDNF